IGIETFRRLSLGALDLCLLQPRSNSADDTGGNLILQLEDLRQSTVEVIGPKMGASSGIDKLARNAKTVTGLAHAAFENIAHPEFPADLFYVHCPILVGEARVACDD